MNSHCPSILRKTRLLPIFLIGLVVLSTDAKVLPDPIIGERCEDMANRRKEKYQYKQRIYELLTKNRNLRAQTPPQKEKLNRHLYKIHNDLNQRRHLIEAQILNLEEEIIRKGCPGLPVGDLKEGQELEKIESSAPTAENLEKNNQETGDVSPPIEASTPATEEKTENTETEAETSAPSSPVITPNASPAEISTETEELLKQDTNLTNPESSQSEPPSKKNDTGTTP